MSSYGRKEQNIFNIHKTKNDSKQYSFQKNIETNLNKVNDNIEGQLNVGEQSMNVFAQSGNLSKIITSNKNTSNPISTPVTNSEQKNNIFKPKDLTLNSLSSQKQQSLKISSHFGQSTNIFHSKDKKSNNRHNIFADLAQKNTNAQNSFNTTQHVNIQPVKNNLVNTQNIKENNLVPEIFAKKQQNQGVTNPFQISFERRKSHSFENEEKLLTKSQDQKNDKLNISRTQSIKSRKSSQGNGNQLSSNINNAQNQSIDQIQKSKNKSSEYETPKKVESKKNKKQEKNIMLSTIRQKSLEQSTRQKQFQTSRDETFDNKQPNLDYFNNYSTSRESESKNMLFNITENRSNSQSQLSLNATKLLQQNKFSSISLDVNTVHIKMTQSQRLRSLRSGQQSQLISSESKKQVSQEKTHIKNIRDINKLKQDFKNPTPTSNKIFCKNLQFDKESGIIKQTNSESDNDQKDNSFLSNLSKKQNNKEHDRNSNQKAQSLEKKLMFQTEAQQKNSSAQTPSSSPIEKFKSSQKSSKAGSLKHEFVSQFKQLGESRGQLLAHSKTIVESQSLTFSLAQSKQGSKDGIIVNFQKNLSKTQSIGEILNIQNTHIQQQIIDHVEIQDKIQEHKAQNSSVESGQQNLQNAVPVTFDRRSTATFGILKQQQQKNKPQQTKRSKHSEIFPKIPNSITPSSPGENLKLKNNKQSPGVLKPLTSSSKPLNTLENTKVNNSFSQEMEIKKSTLNNIIQEQKKQNKTGRTNIEEIRKLSNQKQKLNNPIIKKQQLQKNQNLKQKYKIFQKLYLDLRKYHKQQSLSNLKQKHQNFNLNDNQSQILNQSNKMTWIFQKCQFSLIIGNKFLTLTNLYPKESQRIQGNILKQYEIQKRMNTYQNYEQKLKENLKKIEEIRDRSQKHQQAEKPGKIQKIEEQKVVKQNSSIFTLLNIKPKNLKKQKPEIEQSAEKSKQNSLNEQKNIKYQKYKAQILSQLKHHSGKLQYFKITIKTPQKSSRQQNLLTSKSGNKSLKQIFKQSLSVFKKIQTIQKHQIQREESNVILRQMQQRIKPIYQQQCIMRYYCDQMMSRLLQQDRPMDQQRKIVIKPYYEFNNIRCRQQRLRELYLNTPFSEEFVQMADQKNIQQLSQKFRIANSAGTIRRIILQ